MHPMEVLPFISRDKIIGRPFMHRLLSISFMFLLVIYGISIWWWVHPIVPVEILNEPVPVIDASGNRIEVASPGDFIFLDVSYKKNVDVPGTVNRQIVGDGIIYGLGSYTTDHKPGSSKYRIGIRIPYRICSGKYYINTVVVYDVNPIKSVSVQYRSQTFEVKEK